MKFFRMFLIILSVLGFCSTATIASKLETYIVRVESPDSRISTQSSSSSVDLEHWYKSFLPTTVAGGGYGKSRMVFMYRNVMKGFAAKLSAEEVKEMGNKDGFISASPERILPLHTTHSPGFLGLQQNMGLWRDSSYGKGVIIGVLDTGIARDHPSFSDEGMPPPPARWKGVCELNFTACNNKVIGARSFSERGRSVFDEDGHGSHTAGTAAGNFVRGANVNGNANGTAAGVAPLAHLAIYKVCNEIGCPDSQILAAMDKAIEDGVDILSLSLGGMSDSFHEDNIALGAYSAMEKGIFVSASAGNEGPFIGSLSNEAPWMLTVGASTLDRKLSATVVLGNRQEFHGETAFQPKDLNSTLLPLVFPGQNSTDESSSPYCDTESLRNADVRGKIVVCVTGGFIDRRGKGEAVKNASGRGMILIEYEEYGITTSATAHVIPAIDITYADGEKILAYINSTANPVATFAFKGTITGDKNAPMVAAFSSRGPNRESPGILKPDIIGPGVNILAPWPTSVDNKPNSKSTFNIISGTSMSCPHLSGVAALLKSSHPDWSPAMIKSAMMTTADIVNHGQNPIQNQRLVAASVFSIGAGHVNPSKANDPGLVYDTKPEDYLPYLCGLNYTNREVGVILQRRVNCSAVMSIPEAQLNYPSFSIVLESTAQTYTRTVTNVGEARSFYTVEILEPPGVKVNVEPRELQFSKVNQKLTYNVTFSLSKAARLKVPAVVQGALRWKSAKHNVRTPIATILI
nr:subtilisin-like protease SBT1.7 [Ipomoea trifida]